jgi:ubiquinone/menaquinone biosynthesis C-methylase UbiE
MVSASGGEVADYCAKYRRGYDASVIDWLADAVGLDSGGAVVDLGCGTGQLAIPISARARAVVAGDPEPDMLVRGAAASADAGRVEGFSVSR